jgi:hypothetical protein
LGRYPEAEEQINWNMVEMVWGIEEKLDKK